MPSSPSSSLFSAHDSERSFLSLVKSSSESAFRRKKQNAAIHNEPDQNHTQTHKLSLKIKLKINLNENSVRPNPTLALTRALYDQIRP